MKSLAILCVSLFLFLPTVFAEEEPPSEFPVRVFEKTLGNGLKILVIPRKGVPASPCAVAYDVGSVNERVGQTGMAHYLEHMMFKGTKKTGVTDLALDAKLRQALDEVIAETIRLEDSPATDETAALLKGLREKRDRLIEEQKANLEINQLFKIYREAGSTFTNAMTSNDMTIYIASLPPEKLELFFWVESDRLRNIIFRQFHAEKDVVREERRMYENRPGALFAEEVERTIFGSHPYAHPVLGYHEDLRRMTREELRAFWSTYYSPDNAVVYVGGDVDPERIFALAEKYFGSIPASTRKKPRIPMLDITKNGEIRMFGQGRGRDSYEINFRVPAAGSEEALALSFLASYLGDEEGELFKDLVEKEKLTVDLRARYDARRYGGVLFVAANLSETGTPEAVEKRILAAIGSLRDGPLSEESMADLRRRYRARVLGSVRNDMRIGFRILRREMAGSWRDIERDLVRSRTLPADDLHAAAREYLVRENSVVAIFRKAEEAERSAPPVQRPAARRVAPTKPAAAASDVPESYEDLTYERRVFGLPSGAEARLILKNGIRTFLVPSLGEPVFRISARVQGGSLEDPPGKEGLTSLAAAVLGEAGIPGLTPEALRKHLEEMVASVATGSDLTSHSVSVTVFPVDVQEGLRILRQLLEAPELDAEAFERLKAGRISQLEASESRLGSVTSRLYGRLTWGDVPETRQATRESLESITLDDVRKRLAEVTGPERIIVAAAGDFEMAPALAMIAKALDSFRPEGVAAYEMPKSKNDPAVIARGLHLRNMPVSQGSVRIGNITVPRQHADAPALRVLSTILSRRIFNQIRSVHGLSYQAGARFGSSWRNDSRFTLVFQTKCESVPFAIHLARMELEKMIAEGPTSDELADALGNLDSGFRRTFGRGFDSAQVFAGLEADGVALDYYEGLRKAYAAVTLAKVQEVAGRYLDPARAVILCVGDVEKMKQGDGVHENRLEDFGEATVHEGQAVAAGPSTPTDVVRKIIEELKAGNTAVLEEHGAEPLRKRFDENPQLEMQLKMFSQMLGNATVGEPEVKVEGETAEVTVKTKVSRGGNEMDINLLFDLVKEGDAWKCARFGMKR